MELIQKGTLSVGTIHSLASARYAYEHPDVADAFEFRVDATLDPEVVRIIEYLKSHGKIIILTVRHPDEGGREKDWDTPKRLALFFQYLYLASIVDIEANSVFELMGIIHEAKSKNILVLISCHFLDFFPTLTSLEMALSIFCEIEGDIFKMAVFVTEEWQMKVLDNFADRAMRDFPGRVAPMAVGAGFGPDSRRRYAEKGAALVYCSLADAVIAGQIPAVEFKEFLKSIRS